MAKITTKRNDLFIEQFDDILSARMDGPVIRFWFGAATENSANWMFKFNALPFIEFCIEAKNWLVYQAMSGNKVWNDSGILPYDSGNSEYVESNSTFHHTFWSLDFSEYDIPSIILSDENYELSIPISYDILVDFFEWGESLNEFL